MRIAHFTSELTGGAGVAAQRLNDALRRQGLDSLLYYETGPPLVAGCERVFENQSFTRWRRPGATGAMRAAVWSPVPGGSAELDCKILARSPMWSTCTGFRAGLISPASSRRYRRI
jgi:hypothetical protein